MARDATAAAPHVYKVILEDDRVRGARKSDEARSKDRYAFAPKLSLPLA